MSDNLINTISILFKRIKVGDETALVQLFETVDRYVYGVANKILSDHGLAEDVLIDTFEAFTRNLCRISRHEVILDWLRITARNKSLNILRKRKRESIYEDSLIEQVINNNNDVAATVDDSLIIEEALATLSENERMAILLKAKRYTYDEISELLGVSRSKVQQFITHVQHKLKNFLK